MTKKIIFVSQRPGPGKRGREHLTGTAGKRLASLINVDHEELTGYFEYVVLLPAKWDGAGGKEEASKLVARADYLRKRWRGRKVVLLGASTAMAFRLREELDYQWFRPVQIPPDVEVVVMPNPGGVTSWWRDPQNVEAAREFMLRARLGFFGTGTKNSREQFSLDQVAAALEAGRGVFTWAAEALSEESGRSCSHETIRGYVKRYPEVLLPVLERMRTNFFGKAAKNIIQSVESGDVASSWKVWRTRTAKDSMAALGVDLTQEEELPAKKVENQIEHRSTQLITKMGSTEIDLSRYSEDQLNAIADFIKLIEDGSKE